MEWPKTSGTNQEAKLDSVADDNYLWNKHYWPNSHGIQTNQKHDKPARGDLKKGEQKRSLFLKLTDWQESDIIENELNLDLSILLLMSNKKCDLKVSPFSRLDWNAKNNLLTT